jgi:uncharacterized protein YbjT (DUF2867 family)
MKLVIFGASGSVGRHLIQQAVARGHDVTAFTRDPARLDAALLDPSDRGRVRVEQGDVLDEAAVSRAVAGQDAVLVVLGAGHRGNLRAPGTDVVVRAMRRHGVRRLLCQTTLGVGESRGNLTFFWKRIMFGGLLRAAYADHVRQERLVTGSGLDWTIIRPGAFTDGPRTGVYRHGFPRDDGSRVQRIARADVADFMLHELAGGDYLGRTPALAY